MIGPNAAVGQIDGRWQRPRDANVRRPPARQPASPGWVPPASRSCTAQAATSTGASRRSMLACTARSRSTTSTTPTRSTTDDAVAMRSGTRHDADDLGEGPRRSHRLEPRVRRPTEHHVHARHDRRRGRWASNPSPPTRLLIDGQRGGRQRVGSRPAGRSSALARPSCEPRCELEAGPPVPARGRGASSSDRTRIWVGSTSACSHPSATNLLGDAVDVAATVGLLDRGRRHQRRLGVRGMGPNDARPAGRAGRADLPCRRRRQAHRRRASTPVRR